MRRRLARLVAGSNLTAMICFTYLCMSIAWVYLAELITQVYIAPETRARFAHASGILFAVVSTLAIFLLYGRSERRLRAQEAHYRTIVETTRDGIWLLNLDGITTYANHRLAEMLGYGREDLIGEPISRFVDLQNAPDLVNCLRAVPGECVESSQIELQRADGTSCWAIFSAAPLLDGDGRAAGTIGVVTDVTDHRRAESAQRLAAVGQLAAGVSHEFNNILAGMLMQAELLAMRDQSGASARLVETVRTGAERGGVLCKQLMTFAQPTSARKEEVVVEQVIEAALRLTSPQLRGTDIRVERQFAADPKVVHGDPTQLEQVFAELFINAAHAMPRGGVLTISTLAKDGPQGVPWLEVAVHDTGEGMTPDQVSRVFEPFFTTKGRLGESEVAGSGLGLSAAHGIVTAHGGRLHVKSTPRKGSTFTVELPCAVAKQTEPAPMPFKPERLSGKGCRVLVADDEEEVRSSLEQILTIAGYAVTTACDAKDALRELELGEFDIVVTDLLMPGGGGRAVLTYVAEHAPGIPVVLITGKLHAQEAQQLGEIGARACLQKPFQFDELLRVIGQAIPEDTLS
ncbi:MAG: response regulator [Armatimonadetes bacterium]|nr:response regulator [Armatimonadota bacterium]